MKRLFLIDGTSLAYRSFFAFIKNPLKNSKGETTSAPYGFTNSILKLLNEYNPEYILVVFDAKGKTMRHKIYEEYKAQRPKIPKGISDELPKIKEIVKYLGIKTYEEPGIEADDVIGILSKKAEEKGFETVIFSGDKDFLQLVDKNVKIMNPKDFKLYDETNSIERIGVPPDKVIDFLALSGDSADNIPGIKGIGPKTAITLLKQFNNLSDIYENINKIGSERLRKMLLTGRDRAFLSQELATIKLNYQIGIGPTQLKRKNPNKKKLLNILTDLEFFSIIKKLGQKEEVAGPIPLLSSLLEKVEKVIGITSKGDHYGIAVNEKTGFDYELKDTHLIERFLGSKEIRKVTDNAKSLFSKFSVDGKIFDTSIASYLLAPGFKNYNIEFLSLKWLGNSPSNSGEKAKFLLKLYPILKKELTEKNLNSLFYGLEMPLARVLARMEKNGVLIDRNYFSKESSRLNEEIKETEKQVFSLAGTKFNLRSPKQIAWVLFDLLKIPAKKRTKTGYSTDVEVLSELAPYYEIAGKILTHRELYKLKSTYIDAIPLLADTDGRVRTKWCQTATTTGRLSSINPNLQNIPRKETRKGFIAPSGELVLSADYSQIELRIMAHLSGDENLIQSFKNGEDIHRKTASLVFNIPESMVSKEERRRAKVVNFGIIYGMGPYGLSNRLGISVNQAQEFINSYFLVYPGVKNWIEKTIEKVHSDGWVETILGRRRYFEGNLRNFDERAAINAPVQGSAADLIKLAMLAIDKEIEGTKTKMVLQVHDELVFEVPESDIEEIKEIVKDRMENAIPLKVPVICDIGIGKNWYEAH